MPFTGAGETEQRLRAARLAEGGLVQVVDEGELTPAALAGAPDAALAAPPAAAAGLDLDGAAKSAALISRLAASWSGKIGSESIFSINRL